MTLPQSKATSLGPNCNDLPVNTTMLANTSMLFQSMLILHDYNINTMPCAKHLYICKAMSESL